MEPVDYIDPSLFEKYRKSALDHGFEMVESSPLVRSSFHAERHIKRAEN
jgi:lipoic acid synthetase